jgi:glycerol-3-phosphate dehydrogenase (NAD(P)+)
VWTQDAKKAERINADHRIDRPVQVEFPPNVSATNDLKTAVKEASIVLFCCPSQAVRTLAERLKSCLPPSTSTAGAKSARTMPILVSAVKGLELSTLKRMSEVLQDELPGYSVATLSGPNLAGEIIRGLPTATVIACQSIETARWLQERLTVPTLRLYSNDDVVGVELGGTLKNIIAIAAGVSDGLNLGANAKAALLTRGLAEITRLAVKLGARPLTMAGLAGMGDLLATAEGPSSRNYRLGMELAKGRTTAEILADMEVAVEGVPTAQAVCELSQRLGIELPIAELVEATLKGKSSPDRAIMTLMSRPLSSE